MDGWEGGWRMDGWEDGLSMPPVYRFIVISLLFRIGQGPPSAARALVALPSIAICNIFAILLSSLVLETTEHLVYFTIVSSELFRSFFYPTSLALLELAYVY